MNIQRCLSFSLILLLVVSNSFAARILVVFVFPMKSHFMMSKALIGELISRGHKVTFVTNFAMEENLGVNYTEVLIDPVYDLWAHVREHFQSVNLFELKNLSVYEFIKNAQMFGGKTTEHALKEPKIKEIFHRKDTNDVYDLLIAQQFHQEAFLVLGLKYNIPVITISTLGYANHMSQMMGLISPWSFVPHGYLQLDDKMTFWERVHNTFASLYEDFYREYVYFPEQDALVKKYLSHLPMKIPKVSQMEKNISLMLLNSHVPLTTPRPSMLGMIPVGGMHIYPAKPLPADIKKFLDEATHGVIYFNLGSNVQSTDMPPEKLKLFLEVFANMKQRILWKFEDDKVPQLLSNVMIKKWMPQNDILAHPKVKVFITHGGLFSIQEGVYYGVPMLGMPIYCDQYLNMNKATKAGYAITLNFENINKDILKHSLTDLLENPSYKKNVQRISKIFRDRPSSARDTAMYWVEYVIRHKGAYHLRSAGLDLAWYEFYLLDVIGLILLTFAVIFGGLYSMIKLLIANAKGKVKTN